MSKKKELTPLTYKVCTAVVHCTIGARNDILFGVVSALLVCEYHRTFEVMKELLALELAYQLKADSTQKLFRGMKHEEVYRELFSSRYSWRIFENKL